MPEMWQALGGVAALVTAMAGIIKVLVDRYFKQATELEELKKNYGAKMLEDLKSTVTEHKKELKILGEKIEKNTSAQMMGDRKLQVLTEDLRKYALESEEKFEKFQSEIVKLGKEVFMVRGKILGGKSKN